jgi:hypothetical protein
VSHQLKNVWQFALLFCALICIVSFSGCIKGGSSSQAEYKPTPSAEEAAEIQKMRQLEALKAKSPEYVTLPDKVQLTQEPYINKKIALFKTWQGSRGPDQELQNYFGAFINPGEEVIKELLANSPDEVGTVVMVEDNSKERGCKEVPKGNYRDAETGDVYGGYVEVCELTIVDRQIPAVILRKKFEGKLDDREYIRKGSGKVVGRVDYGEVYSFLTSLPRR